MQDGKVIFVREGSQVYRVSANRVVRVGEELRIGIICGERKKSMVSKS